MCHFYFIWYSREIELFFSARFIIPHIGVMIWFPPLFLVSLVFDFFWCGMNICSQIHDSFPVLFGWASDDVENCFLSTWLILLILYLFVLPFHRSEQASCWSNIYLSIPFFAQGFSYLCYFSLFHCVSHFHGSRSIQPLAWILGSILIVAVMMSPFFLRSLLMIYIYLTIAVFSDLSSKFDLLVDSIIS